MTRIVKLTYFAGPRDGAVDRVTGLGLGRILLHFPRVAGAGNHVYRSRAHRRPDTLRLAMDYVGVRKCGA